jgi:hypothetical protein
MRRMRCGGGGRGVAPFYRVGVVVEGSGGDRPARWVLTPPVLKVLKGGEGIRRGVGLMREGGGTVQWLGFSWCTRGARHTPAVAGRTGGGGASDRRRETTPSMGQAGPNGLMTRAGRENSRKKIKWAAREFWAGLETG